MFLKLLIEQLDLGVDPPLVPATTTMTYAAISATVSTDTSSAVSSGGGAYIAAGCRNNIIRIFACDSGQLVLTLVGHDNWIRALLFHPCGRYLVSSSDDCSVRVWDLSRGGKQVRKLDTDNFVTCLAWSGSRTLPAMASGGLDHAFKIWELK